MTAARPSRRTTTLALLLCPLANGLQGQTWSESRPLRSASHTAVAFDTARNRLVAIAVDEHANVRVWEHDDQRWLACHATTASAGATAPTATYDEARGETVALCLPDMLRWDGSSWRTSRFPGRGTPSLCYDSTRRVVVATTAGFGAETWEWDGSSWTQRSASPRPFELVQWPETVWSALAYDARRARSVLVGKTSLSTHTECWEWDGQTWLQRADLPSPRTSGHLAYDARRGRVVLFGGYDLSWRQVGDTWEFDGTTWQLVGSSQIGVDRGLVWSPQRRACVRVFGEDCSSWQAWDGVAWSNIALPQAQDLFVYAAFATNQARAQIVLAHPDTAAIAAPNLRTSIWDGLRVQRLSPVTAPSSRIDHVMAFDERRQRAVLFGGRLNVGSISDETWEFDGVTWQLLRPSLAPSPRRNAMLTYDAARQRCVLFGGAGNTDTDVRSDTWEWDGTQWQQRATAAAPPARHSGAFAYDPQRQRCLLFGGYGQAPPFADTWEWDGSQWRSVTATGPTPRGGATLTFDPSRAQLVLFGGCTLGPQAAHDAWQFDGVAWSSLGTTTGPPGRDRAVLAFDLARRRLLVMGGRSCGMDQQSRDDRWFLGPTSNASAPFGSACGAARLRGKGVAAPGEDLVCDLRGPDPNSAAVVLLGASPANFDVGNGCRLWVDNLFALVPAGLDANGLGATALRIPPTLALRGLAVYAQAVASSNTGPSLGLAWSAGWRFQIGD